MKSKLTRIFFGSAAFALLATQAAAEGKISGITTKPVSDGLEVQINGDGLSAPKITRVMGGRSFMLEFDASLVSDPQWIRVEQDGVHYVQSVWSQSSPARIRIHLRVDPDTRIDVTPDAGGFLVRAESPTAIKKPIKADLGSHGSITMFREPDHLATAPAAPATPQQVPVVETAASRQRTVSLDFVNTDVVQILKALALEAGVNIVTSPDVKGSLTVSLGTVSIKEALDLVTTMDGLKYGKVGNTYVVTTAENFPHVLSTLSNKNADMAVARVVPIYSGEGPNIKDALRTTSNDVEILLPSDKPLSQQMVSQESQAINGGNLASLATKGGAQNGAGAAAASGGSSGGNGSSKVIDNYVILVGPAGRLDAVEQQIKQVDSGLCRAEGISYPLSDNMVHEIYHPQGTNAGLLLGSLIMTDGSGSGAASSSKAVYSYSFDSEAGYSSVRAFATPEGSTSEQTIVLTGRENEVNRLMDDLKSLDSLTQNDTNFVVYEVRYLDPRALREDLVAKFPGLAVNVPPAGVINSATYQQGSEFMQSQQKSGQSLGATAGANSQPSGGNAAANGSSSSTATPGSDTGSTPGLTAPFAADEQNGVPMKLVLHGAPELIDDAMSYLKAVDVEPKQVALELRVMDLSKEDALNLGLNWNLLTGGTVQDLGNNQGGPVQANPPGLATNLSSQALSGFGMQGLLGFGGGGSLGVTATLDKLAGTNKMIARPNILALDGRESEMFVGQDVKYIQQIQSTQNGVSVNIGDVNVGVKLAVLPRIGGNNDISMELRPEVSTLLGFTPVPGGGEIPETGLRIAQSTMVVHDGDTIAIGGLIQDSDKKSRGGVPILRDIPILNLLFGRTNNDHTRDEVVFFLTARVVDDNSIHNAASPFRSEPMMDLTPQKSNRHHK